MRRSTVLVAVAVAILASSCTAWSWGNRYGGGPSTPTEDTPGWIATASSAFHTCRLAADRTVWCHGENRFGEVGDGTGLETDDFVQIGADTWRSLDTTGTPSTCGVRTEGTLWCWGVINDGTYPPDPDDLVDAPEQVGLDTDWATVFGGWQHWCATKVDGTLWCWGWNPNYQLGDGTREYRATPVLISSDRWRSIGGGYSVTCGVQADHTLWCWGVDLLGESGHGGSEDGNTEYPMPTRVGDDADWREVSLADSSACATKLDGTLWCWGDYTLNSGTAYADVPTRLGTTEDRTEPVQVGVGQVWIDVSVFWTVDALAVGAP